MHYLNVNNLARTQSLDTFKSQNSDARFEWNKGPELGKFYHSWHGHETGRSASSVSDYEFHA